MNTIPLFSEIPMEDIVDTYWYKFYPTIIHKEKDSPWFGPGSFIREQKENIDKYTNYLMWGKSK